MGLDARGNIAAAEIALYIPVLLIGVFLALRHGFKREAGWVFLVVLSIVRIIGGVTHVLSEHDPSNSTERTIYSIMEAAGLSPLLTASLGFLRTVTQYSPLEENTLLTRGLRIVGLIGTIGLALAISGGVSAGDATSQSDLNSALTQRHAGVILFIVMYAGVVGTTIFCWQSRSLILRYRRQLLIGVTATLPFLGIRVLYSVLSSFSPYPLQIVDGQQVLSIPSNSGLGKFSTVSSEWGLYLIMSVLMEYIAVIIYVVVGIITPLGKDAPPVYAKEDGSSESYMMGGSQQQQYPQQQYWQR
ncbi:hypothetical protein K466DRAFT_479360 [Polyporus arcularius HHB13444]|uniref:DUF7702 domain-containing protein n=1 Tax=Polyporus arcularius HHB13444 TaxID=1314778 RepID=A0A5C3PWF4_9APHY|nr:hypothetical protein K466DRAFT_479360 [Polyporus arcularius HHB13444]